MKKQSKRLLSLLLGALMAASVFTAGASAAAPTGETGKFAVVTTKTIEEEKATAGPVTEVEKEPMFMTFSSVGSMNRTKVMLYKHDGVQEGQQKLVLNSGEDNSMQLLYSPGSSFPNYRMMFKFNAANLITPDYKYARLTYKVVDDTAGVLGITNNGGGSITVVPNTAESKGEWTTTNVFDISAGGILQRFIDFKHVTLHYDSPNPEAKVYIKEIGFFTTEASAYKHYGDSYDPNATAASSYSLMTFGAGGTGTVTAQAPAWGLSKIDEENSTLNLLYNSTVNNMTKNTGYMAKILFTGGYDPTNYFVRVHYAAKNPEGIESANLYLANDAAEGLVCVARNIKNTNGEYVLGDTFSMAPSQTGRLSSGKHCSLFTDVSLPGGEYSIKGIYFFPSREAAEKFELGGGDANLTINGNSIEEYKIVINKDNSGAATAAEKLQKQIRVLTGVIVPVVGDTEAAESEYEILVGRSNRELSYKKFNELQEKEYKYNRFLNFIEGNKLVVVAELPNAHSSAVDSLLRTYLYLNMPTYPDDIELTSSLNLEGVSTAYNYTEWANPADAANPVRFNDNFAIDDGYWQEENNAQNWVFKNGTYTVDAADYALSYLHVYEKNVKFNSKWMYTKADADAAAGLMLRYCADDAFVKAGYDFGKGEWYIEYREGLDFELIRAASAKMTVAPGTWYNLGFTVNGNTAALTVNGQKVLESTRIGQVTPGRVAFYADGAEIAVDDADITLTSGEGAIIKDIVHTIIPENSYMEGGSAWGMNDGSVIFMSNSGITYKSIDNGYTWEKTAKWTDPMGYPNIIRLNNGDFLRISAGGGYYFSETSSDEGKTWTKGGNICLTANAGNMNDKVLQAADSGKWKNRIFYGMNYQVSAAAAATTGREVFCEFYYSDDNGKTWTKSDTDSWDIKGNEWAKYFGECKMLVCDDDTVRVYNSWSDYSTIMYADSTDGGKTFGPLTKLEGFPCARSSMQFVRDPYGPTDTTYYMVWVNNEPISGTPMPRARLTLAYSTDGKNWDVLGDIWRWESNFWLNGSHINHLVDPFIQVTEDYVICGSGASAYSLWTSNYHHQQRQNIWSVPKASLHAENLGSFTDVTTANSYYDAVKFVTEKGLFNGTSATTFSPATEMTRSMFVTVLGRLDGADVAKYTTPTFKDVAAGQWYTSYVEWAAANSIVNGIGGGLYGINNNVSVEQVCVMLARYAENKAAAEASGKTLANFSDSASVSTWATDGVKWAVENGIYTGSGNILDAGAPASRALVAEMLMNYVNVYGE